MTAKVFVRNLSHHATEGRLADLLAEAGQVVDVYLPVDRGSAIVEFSTEDAAAKCIAKFDGHEFAGKTLSIIAADAPRH